MKRYALLAAAALVLGSCGQKKTSLTTEEVERRTLVETVSASGKIQPETEVKITSEVSGQIIGMPVKEGDLVRKGDLLLQINPDLYESAVNRGMAALNTSRSNLANAKARGAQARAQFQVQELNFARSEKLFNQGAISQSEWDNAQSSYQVAQAEVEAADQSVMSAEFAIQSAQATLKEAQDNLRRTTIMAPQDGTVTALTKEVGETVLGNQMMAGETIMKISQLGLMEVNVEVNESDIVRVALGDTATVEVDAYQDEVFKGVVTEIGNTALNSLNGMALSMDQVTNFSVKIRILAESYNHLCESDSTLCIPFRPGMSATVEVETERATDVITVPIRAISTRQDTLGGDAMARFKARREAEASGEDIEPFVVAFVANKGKGMVDMRVLETGVQDSRYIQILSGLEEGEEVVTGPYVEVSKNLSDGTQVQFSGGRDRHEDSEAEEEE